MCIAYNIQLRSDTEQNTEERDSLIKRSPLIYSLKLAK